MIKKALCIGNAQYPAGAELRNPTNDASDLSQKLNALGFESRLCTDETYKGMDVALQAFASDLSDAEVGLFFFAGHGMQIDGENYLAGIDTNFDTEIDAKHSSLRLNKVIDVLNRGKNNTSIVILDACRSNPYERRWRDGTSLGLAPVYAPKGTIIAYGTSPGEFASDGYDNNGAFTGAILKHITEQDFRIEDLFKRVRNTLSAMTSGKQTSWEHTSLMGDFYFNPPVLTNEFITEYSSEAKADTKFYVAGSSLRNILGGLKSHTWDSQNSAMSTLHTVEWHSCNKDELFVLGRNIYQAACGTAKHAESYLSNLLWRFEQLDKEVAFHILNGILYEIYFDSSDRFRQRLKVSKIADVFALEGDERFQSSFQFIQQSLRPYYNRLFYVPGSGKTVAVDVVIKLIQEASFEVTRIIYDSQDVLFAFDGVTLIANYDASYYPSFRRFLMGAFEAQLAIDMAVPSYRLAVAFSDSRVQSYPLQILDDYKIQRLSA